MNVIGTGSERHAVDRTAPRWQVAVIDAAIDIHAADRGLVDCQVNGAGGVDLTETPSGLWRVAELLGADGVGAFLPTLVSPGGHEVRAALDALAAGPPDGWSGAVPLGWHIEGPVLNPARAGAHPPERLRAPDAIDIGSWHPHDGVRMVTLAPELPGALDLVTELASRGVVVSLGHSEADERTVELAVAAGARAVTHLFNAMSPLHHRRPGIVGAVLGGAPLVAGLVCDGVHVAPSVLRAAWRALGPGRRMVVSDCAAPALMPAGDHRLAGRTVTSDGTTVTTADGTLAGSALTLPAALVRLMAMGIDGEEALSAATEVPHRLLGV